MPKRLVLIEDSPLQGTWFQQELLRYGLEVDLAPTGAQGLERIRTDRPDGIILDVTLPDTDGYTLCRELKADRVLADIPVVILTGRSAREATLEGLNVGADAYIPKDQDAVWNVVTVLRQFGVEGTPQV
jgi:DNA-binding response OmpR family regulator